MTKSLLIVSCLALFSDLAIAQNLMAGKARVEAICRTCHGLDGIGTLAGVPNLSGQKMDYMVNQLKAFKTGRREHAQMSIIAQMLSDEDIENVASWYANVKIRVEAPE